MPTYEYACRDCSRHLEIVQSFTDDSLTECPTCGGRLRKVFGNIGIAFKGSGFYKNDSRVSSNGSHGSKDAKSDSSKKEAAKGDFSHGDSSKGDSSKGDSAKGDSSKGDSSTKGAGGSDSSPSTPSKPNASKAAAS
ncbi:MAG: FmdB family zinc ribbon protein [Acidimicrobiales bacterium]